MMDEQSLCKAVIRGDRTAQRELYVRFAGCAASVAMRYVVDRDAMQDVLQDSFIKAYSSIHRFEYRSEGSLKGWLMRIVANESLNYLKRHAHFVYTDEIPDEMDENDEEEQATDKVPPDKLMEMIASLPAGYRAVLNLFVFEQKSHKEIAALLGIKENTSASQYLRAKKLLARKINDYLRQRQ